MLSSQLQDGKKVDFAIEGAYWSERSEAKLGGLMQFLDLDATKWQHTHGVRRVEAISPDNWLIVYWSTKRVADATT